MMRRRRFFTLGMLGAGALLARPGRVHAQPPKEARVSPSDPLAAQLGYVENATSANKAKFPQYRPEQKCSNCQLYQGTGAWAPCTIFPGKQVPAAGWCSAWVKKVT